MSFPMDIVEGYISEVIRPIGNLIVNTVTHPIEALQSIASASSHFVQNNPYTCATIIGLGAYAMHRGNLKFENNKVHVRFNLDTPLGACNWSTSHRIGPKL